MLTEKIRETVSAGNPVDPTELNEVLDRLDQLQELWTLRRSATRLTTMINQLVSTNASLEKRVASLTPPQKAKTKKVTKGKKAAK